MVVSTASGCGLLVGFALAGGTCGEWFHMGPISGRDNRRPSRARPACHSVRSPTAPGASRYAAQAGVTTGHSGRHT